MIFLQIESGLTLAALGYMVVFAALLVLYIIFKNLSALINLVTNKQVAAAPTGSDAEQDLSGEVNAAIGTALHLYFNEAHDEDALKLTIARVSKTYSPWSSKIYGVINLNRRY